MKKTLPIFLFCILSVFVYAQPVYLATGGNVEFFSETPVENIEARTNSMTSVLNTENNEIVFNVPMRTFIFERSLMQEHFNENYVESDKYPVSIYKGKIETEINWEEPGTYAVVSEGALNLHGVEVQRKDSGTVVISDGQIVFQTEFFIRPADHKIEIPKLVATNIAEIIQVKLECTYQPYKKTGN